MPLHAKLFWSELLLPFWACPAEPLSLIHISPKIVKYLDLPMQHGSDRLLRAMNRHASRDQMIQVVEELRKQIPGIVIRTSLIVGFPGETDDDFDELLDFIRIVKPERAGVLSLIHI